MEPKKANKNGSMVSHFPHIYSFIPVIHSNLFQNIPVAQKYFEDLF